MAQRETPRNKIEEYAFTLETRDLTIKQAAAKIQKALMRSESQNLPRDHKRTKNKRTSSK